MPAIRALNELPGTAWPDPIGGVVDRPRGVIMTGDLTNDGTPVEWRIHASQWGLTGHQGLLHHPVIDWNGIPNRHMDDAGRFGVDRIRAAGCTLPSATPAPAGGSRPASSRPTSTPRCLPSWSRARSSSPAPDRAKSLVLGDAFKVSPCPSGGTGTGRHQHGATTFLANGRPLAIEAAGDALRGVRGRRLERRDVRHRGPLRRQATSFPRHSGQATRRPQGTPRGGARRGISRNGQWLRKTATESHCPDWPERIQSFPSEAARAAALRRWREHNQPRLT